MHALRSLGEDIRAVRASTALVEAGYEVRIVDVVGEDADRAEAEVDGVHVEHMIAPRSFVSSRFERWALIRSMRLLIHGTLRLLQWDADVYHALDLPALPACYFTAVLRRKRLVFEAYEVPLMMVRAADVTRSRRRLDVAMASVLPAMLRRCAGVITVSPPIVRLFRQQYGCRDVSLVRNVPPYRELARSDRLRQRLDLGPKTRIALYQGNLDRSRSLDLLVRSARFLEPHHVVVMMGHATETVQTDLAQLIRSEDVADRVKILPSVSYAELLDWTSSADIGLVVYLPDYSPNVSMMLPNKLFEYLMAGAPVLASELECVADVIRRYDVGWVLSSLEPANVGSAINEALADTSARNRMRVNALRAAREVFCWDQEKAELLGLYDRILYGLQA
jgi:glycosyltransferase involved in cell wall biosynthesis